MICRIGIVAHYLLRWKDDSPREIHLILPALLRRSRALLRWQAHGAAPLVIARQSIRFVRTDLAGLPFPLRQPRAESRRVLPTPHDRRMRRALLDLRLRPIALGF